MKNKNSDTAKGIVCLTFFIVGLIIGILLK